MNFQLNTHRWVYFPTYAHMYEFDTMLLRHSTSFARSN